MHTQVIATELLKGQGLGNQLFCYIATRCLALEKGCDFSILNREILANNIHSNKGMYFMDLDCGLDLRKEDFDRAISFINNWYPPFALRQEIEAKNAQENLF